MIEKYLKTIDKISKELEEVKKELEKEIETPTQLPREEFEKWVEENKERLKGKLCVI